MATVERLRKKAPKSYCDTKCEHYMIVEVPDFTSENGKGYEAFCGHGDGVRSFGCLNCCPKRFGEK